MQGLNNEIVILSDILDARERRSQLQAELRLLHQVPVISITINMPGNIKYNHDIVSMVYTVIERLRVSLQVEKLQLVEERVWHSKAGPAALMAVEADPFILKSISIDIEEEEPFGRLVDIDVFDRHGQQISRGTQQLPLRRCLVCSDIAVTCMREKRHTAAEIADAVNKLIVSHRAATEGKLPKEVEIIGSAALEAMILEALCAPSPGLVDRFNTGAHRDMDIFTFIKSSSALTPAMYRCAMAGWNHRGSPDQLLAVLRAIGIEAEKNMFCATEGVNTQKGLLFLMGIIVAAAALTFRDTQEELKSSIILDCASYLCKGLVERELEVLKDQVTARKLTAGERLYLSHGITGIRGEIEQGLPAVKNRGLPVLDEAFQKGLDLNDALIQTLISLMTVTDDTTILYRHDYEVLQSVQSDASRILDEGGMYTAKGRDSIEKLDQEYIVRNISPGGSADLLAVTYFLHAIEKKFAHYGQKKYNNHQIGNNLHAEEV